VSYLPSDHAEKYARLKEDIVEVGRRIYNLGFVAANDGNISVRVGDDEILTTFPLLRTLDTFELENLEHVKPETIWSLADNNYIRRHENIICMGNPGMGKTHLSIALGILACNDGFRVRFYSAPALANELVEAQENHSLSRLQRQLSKVDLLILDDLSYLSFSRQQSELLFQVISERSERASLVISTNLEFSKWVQFFGDPMLTAALVDRVTHRAHILNMNGESYRLKEGRARQVKVDQP
jgi:DNA replication protein DnaC